jgi:murein DD-endopeptidase MepM/ murein hydrolase activator NlpD
MFRRALLLTVILIFATASLVSAHWPVGSRSSFVSQGYHEGHYGWDIAAPCGTPILALSNGTTVFSGWRNNGGGWQVYVYHGRRVTDGRRVYTAYYHMSRTESYRGEYLSINERLGRMGTTGNSSGCHLHFEMWLGYPWTAGAVQINPWAHMTHGYWLPSQYR